MKQQIRQKKNRPPPKKGRPYEWPKYLKYQHLHENKVTKTETELLNIHIHTCFPYQNN